MRKSCSQGRGHRRRRAERGESPGRRHAKLTNYCYTSLFLHPQEIGINYLHTLPEVINKIYVYIYIYLYIYIYIYVYIYIYICVYIYTYEQYAY